MDWRELFADCEAAMGEDPSSDRVQALAARWKALVAGFTGGDPEIASGLKKLWSDSANWPAPAKEQMKPFVSPAVWELMQKAMSRGKW